MFILELNQEGIGTEIGLFHTIEEGRAFISQVNGYRCEEEEGFVYEMLDIRKLPEFPLVSLCLPKKGISTFFGKKYRI